MANHLTPILLLCMTAFYGYGQEKPFFHRRIDSILHVQERSLENINPRIYTRNDTAWVYSGICKVLKRSVYKIATGEKDFDKKLGKRKSAISVHGNIQYDFQYRSFIDTPFSQKDFQQHTVQTSLSIVVKDKYPVKVNLSTRVNNSSFFRNFTDINMQFDRSAFLVNKKQQLIDKIYSNYLQNPDLKLAESVLQEQKDKYNLLSERLASPDIAQQIIEEREKSYLKNNQLLSGNPFNSNDHNRKLTYKNRRSIENDSLISRSENSFSEFIKEKRNDLDSIQRIIVKLQQKTDSLRNSFQKDLSLIRQKINKSSGQQELKRIAAEKGITTDSLTRLEKYFSSIRSMGIGRSLLNFSELTAWNVSLTGISIEYNPRLYTAIAAGKIDYGFRDFLGRNTKNRGQQLIIGRIGVGDKDRQAIIFSGYTGKKYNYGSVLSDSVSSSLQVAGYSLEAIIRRGENSLVAEIAKTTIPLSGSFHDNNSLQTLLKFSDQSNVGFNVKGQAVLKLTDTKVSGFYRKAGENFQSFSLFSYNTDQVAWSLKADQPFFKNKVSLMVMLRRNDFTNPFAEKTFKTSTVFKSFQVNASIPKWPVLCIGYYPGTQLYVISRDKITENAYYIVNASVVHTYSLARIRMNSSFNYNKYAGKGTDSGFVSYAGKSLTLSHFLLFNKMQLQGVYNYTDQERMKFYTLEASGDVSVGQHVRMGAGVKYNRVITGKNYWGSRAQLTVDIKKIGGLQFQYEKYYLPTIYQSLFPVESGRIGWFKYF